MKIVRILTAACAIGLLAPLAVQAQPVQATKDPSAVPDYVPRSGQPGKDVVWVPTQQILIDRMFQMARLTKDDYLIDLGSGDGRTVISAAKRGVRALGIEYNPDLVTLSKRTAEAEGVTDKARFVEGDIFETNFSDATVLTLFLLPELNLKLRPMILNMKPGTRVVSNTFMMDDWEPDETAVVAENCSSYCRAYHWVVPAKVAGTWRLGDGELKLAQSFQKLSGTLTVAGKAQPISDARMKGGEISFTAGGRSYTGRVENDRMTGSSEAAGAKLDWQATRSSS